MIPYMSCLLSVLPSLMTLLAAPRGSCGEAEGLACPGLCVISAGTFPMSPVLSLLPAILGDCCLDWQLVFKPIPFVSCFIPVGKKGMNFHI